MKIIFSGRQFKGENMKCPICNNKSNFKFQSELKKEIYQCNDIKCSHLFVENYDKYLGICGTADRGEDLSIEKLKKDRQHRIDTYNVRNKNMFRKMWKKLNLKEDAKILDFGSGDGNLMFSLKQAYPKANVTCIEPHEIFNELLLEVADYIVESVNDLNEKFDLIVLNEVIEHLNFPNSDLQSLNRVLKEGSAAIYIATPLGETHISSNKTGAYNTDSHLHFFTRKSLNMSLEKAGFTPLDVDDINYPIYSTYLDTTIKEKLKYKLKNFILVKLLKINQRSCVLPSGHISGLAYKK